MPIKPTFYGCSSLTEIAIPDNVTLIEKFAFGDCIGLTSITIGGNKTSIKGHAFNNCTGLTSVTLGNGVVSIEESTFEGCIALASIEVSQGNPVYHSAGNCLIETDSKTLIAGCKTSIIPNDGSVTSIGDNAFMGCYELTNITIPDSVTSIGDHAFHECSVLTSITIPDSVPQLEVMRSLIAVD